MATNRGKKFEEVVRKAFEKVPDVSIDRIPDQTAGYLGARNICDFIVYKKPYEYYIECKSITGNTFPLSNITDNQWNGMLEKVKIEGVFAGIICWWVNKGVTKFLPIEELARIKIKGAKSIRYDNNEIIDVLIEGKKKVVFYDYDMKKFLEEMENNYGDNVR